MRYILDHDLHIHSQISPCSSDPRQTPAAILAYGVTNNFRLLCLTDHGWDAKAPTPGPSWLDNGNDMDKLRSVLPLPQAKTCKFIFGIEADMDRFDTLGLSVEEMEKLDFMILSTGHLWLTGFTYDPALVPETPEAKKARYFERLHKLLDREDIPFHKAGLSHFDCNPGYPASLGPKHLWLDMTTEKEFADLFEKAAARGVGIELNLAEGAYRNAPQEELESVLRPYRIAKSLGCKFYFGCDAHHPERFATARADFERVVDLLDLTEDDKFPLVKQLIAE